MIRKLKALGLSLVAVFAMSALTASGASATDFFTTENGQPALMTGVSHDNVFQIGAGSKFECTTSKFAATAVNGASTATVDVLYEGAVNATPHNVPCTASIGTVTIDMNGCHYTLTGNTTNMDPEPDAVVWIVCPAGQTIKITGPLGCTVSVPSQTPTEGGVVYTNLPNHAGGAAVKVTSTTTGITFTATAACGLVGIPSHGNNATYKGTGTVTGYEDTEGLPTPVTEGARVGVSVS